ncbi:GNAT family protein [Streptomyces morookaense]|uniref:GNAT family N-acetyltransferase n=1 Tax=Streptomyces morookaense TaxID=1970 RepID=UPI0033C71033
MSSPHAPHVLLTGERLALGMPRPEALAEYHAWESDPTTILGYGGRFPQPWEARLATWERRRADRDHVQFEVLRVKDRQSVGLTWLQINSIAATAEFAILIAPAMRGKRYAEESTRLTLDWAFHLGALRSVWLRVLEPNRAGLAAYEKAGFRFAGRLRRSGHWLGQCVDELLMDALPEDFPGPSALCGILGK